MNRRERIAAARRRAKRLAEDRRKALNEVRDEIVAIQHRLNWRARRREQWAMDDDYALNGNWDE